METAKTEHIVQAIRQEKEELKLRLRELDELEVKFIGELTTFRCPHGKTNEDAICINCLRLGPKIIRDCNEYRRIFPHNVSKDIAVLKQGSISGCLEWQKKQHEGACGCGGEVFCECGYWTTVCFPPPIRVCLFCGRPLTMRLNGLIAGDDGQIKEGKA